MGRLYDENGAKMNVVQACEELTRLLTEDELNKMSANMCTCDQHEASSHKMLAHAILDTYSSIDSTSDRGQRVRKIMDWLMTKYQKSIATTTEEENTAYTRLILKINGMDDQVEEIEAEE